MTVITRKSRTRGDPVVVRFIDLWLHGRQALNNRKGGTCSINPQTDFFLSNRNGLNSIGDCLGVSLGSFGFEKEKKIICAASPKQKKMKAI